MAGRVMGSESLGVTIPRGVLVGDCLWGLPGVPKQGGTGGKRAFCMFNTEQGVQCPHAWLCLVKRDTLPGVDAGGVRRDGVYGLACSRFHTGFNFERVKPPALCTLCPAVRSRAVLRLCTNLLGPSFVRQGCPYRSIRLLVIEIRLVHSDVMRCGTPLICGPSRLRAQEPRRCNMGLFGSRTGLCPNCFRLKKEL